MADFTSKKTLGPLGGYYRFVVAKHTITTDGHIADLDTGLDTILAAFVQVISDGPTTNTEAAYCTVMADESDGLLDIYAWQDDIATESATETLAYVFVVGT